MSSVLRAVEFVPHFKTLLFRPRPDMVAQSFGIVHVHGFSDAHCNVDSWGPKVVKGVWDEPFVVHPGDVGVFVLQGHGHNGETFLRAGVKHAGTVFEQFRSFVRGAFRKNHDAHSFFQTLPDRGTCGPPAVLAFAVHPNGAKQRSSPSNDRPRFGFDSPDVHHRKAHGEQHGVHVGTVVSHQDRGMVGKLTFP